MQFQNINISAFVFTEGTKVIKEYYPYLHNDLSNIIGYIFPGIIVGFICAVAMMLAVGIKTNKWNWKKTVVYFLFISYVAIVIQIAYLSRQPGTRTDVAFGLGDTWGTTLQEHSYVIENVLMFIPFGILFPMLGKYARWFCIPVAICASAALEGMQYISKRGFCQLDDIVTNTIGACMGYVVFLLIYLSVLTIKKPKPDLLSKV